MEREVEAVLAELQVEPLFHFLAEDVRHHDGADVVSCYTALNLHRRWHTQGPVNSSSCSSRHLVKVNAILAWET